MPNEPLKVAFYGLAASELDLFTMVKRAPAASLELVIDQGPMAIARKLAEIAGVQVSGDPWDLPKAKFDWIVTGKLVRKPAAPLERAEEGGAMVLSVAEAAKRLPGLAPAVATGAAEAAAEAPAGAPETGERAREIPAEVPEAPAEIPPAPAEITEAPSTPPAADMPLAPAAQAGATPVRSAFLRPTETAAAPDEVVGWALEGLISSVRGQWGVAIAKANGDTCLVERGIELETAQPEIWKWLKSTVEKEVEVEPPPESKKLVWVPLKFEARLIGAVVLGRGSEGRPFSKSDRTWLQKVGERIASILSQTASSELKDLEQASLQAPAAVWAAPVLERAAWARDWMRNQFGAEGCWLFAAMEGSSEPQLVDESWGPASPPFLLKTIREAMEETEPQVWLESRGGRAIVLQPLGPWGVKWTVVLEGVPWRGDGRATLARLKKAAGTLARLLKST
jgi:hypothetical protein